MRYIFIFLVFVSFVFGGSYPKSQSLNGLWEFKIQHTPETINYFPVFGKDENKMYLPINWYLAGYNHAGVVWFKKDFVLKKKRNLHYFLEFHGVDYIADIWINNKYIGNHEGYFQIFDFDITKFLKDGKNNVIVRVNSPLENYPENFSLHKTLLKGVFSHHDTRPGGAWDPIGQDRNSGGIYGDIYLKAYKKYKFEKLKITPTIDGENANIEISFFLKGLDKKAKSNFFDFENGFETSKNKKAKIEISPYNFSGKSYQFDKKIYIDKENHLNIILKNPKLWQTYDRGFPFLYKLTIKLDDTKIEEVFGIRSIKKDEKGIFYLNGKPLFLKGTNYISSQYLSEMDESAFRKDLNLMKDANINTIRVHAHIEPKIFYKLCDEMGFLVWQDYNLQWGYVEDKNFNQKALNQAKDMVDQLYNHPSVFLFCIHNEPPWDSPWMKWKYPDYNPNQNKVLDDMLYLVLTKYDRYHMFKKVSSNIEHPWYGWYSKKYTDYAKPSRAMIVSEFGAQALPDYKSLVKIVSVDYIFPKNNKKALKVWKYHNFQPDWTKKNGIKMGKNIYEFIKNSQSYQKNLIKFAAEMLRIQKYKNVSAIYQFMFNEGWPSINWGIVDYYRNPKPGYFALKKAYEPVLPIAKFDGEKVEIYVVNDKLERFKDVKLDIVVFDKIFKSYNFEILPDTVKKIDTVTLPKDANMFKLKLYIKDETISNIYAVREGK